MHTDKYQNFGGHFAAFDPVSNLRVGVKVLQECIARAGSIEGVCATTWAPANLPDDGGYTAKVMAEHFSRLRQVANGRSVPVNAPVHASTCPAATPAQNRSTASRNAGERPSAEADSKVALARFCGFPCQALSKLGGKFPQRQKLPKRPADSKRRRPGRPRYLSYTTGYATGDRRTFQVSPLTWKTTRSVIL